MLDYLISEVGVDKPPRLIEAHNAYDAIAQRAGCSVELVTLPIWCKEAYCHSWHTVHAVACYMPLDDSGRQWILRRADGGAIEYTGDTNDPGPLSGLKPLRRPINGFY